MTGVFSFLIEPLARILLWIQEFTGFSWGWTIVVLTILIRILLIPLGVKQYTSMRAMQKLQPKIKELQKKYKDDKQKLNEETMKFYRENKVNPFGSCLPLLLQMPIFIALYLLLKKTELYIEIRPDVSVSWLWINDIRLKDYAIIFVYIGTQFLSSKLLNTATDKTQQMMMTVMPAFLGVIFLISDFPAGVLIYWVTTNVWTIGQQLVTKRIIQSREEANGAAAAVAASSSKAVTGKSGSSGGGKSGKGGKGGKGGKKKKPAAQSQKSDNRGKKTGGKGNGKTGSKKRK